MFWVRSVAIQCQQFCVWGHIPIISFPFYWPCRRRGTPHTWLAGVHTPHGGLSGSAPWTQAWEGEGWHHHRTHIPDQAWPIRRQQSSSRQEVQALQLLAKHSLFHNMVYCTPNTVLWLGYLSASWRQYHHYRSLCSINILHGGQSHSRPEAGLKWNLWGAGSRLQCKLGE